MRKRTTTALIVGVLAVGALGVWWGPSLMDRDTEVTAPPAAVVSPSAETAKPRRVAPRATLAKKDTEKTTIAPDVAPTLPAMQPELHARLKPVLNRGTRMELAAEGFRDAEQFATVAHAARNTGVPFVVLKHRVLEEDQTLARAIRESKPDLDAEHEVTRASNAARFDIAVITG
jgi:cytoskeletal protein RodZ